MNADFREFDTKPLMETLMAKHGATRVQAAEAAAQALMLVMMMPEYRNHRFAGHVEQIAIDILPHYQGN